MDLSDWQDDIAVHSDRKREAWEDSGREGRISALDMLGEILTPLMLMGMGSHFPLTSLRSGFHPLSCSS